MKPHGSYHGCPNWTTGGCACPDLPYYAAGLVERRSRCDRRARVAEVGAIDEKRIDLAKRLYTRAAHCATKTNAALMNEAADMLSKGHD